MLNCKETTEFVSQSLDEKLGIFTRMKVGFHLAMCKFCRRFNAQMQLMARLFKRVAAEEASELESSDIRMPDNDKERMKAALKKG